MSTHLYALLFAAVVTLLLYLDDRFFGVVAGLWASAAGRQHLHKLRQGTRRSPGDVQAQLALGEELLRQKKAAEAATVLQEAVQQGATGAQIDWLLGAALIRLGWYADGRILLEEAVGRDPDIGDGEPYLYLLREAFAVGDPEAPQVMRLVHTLDRYESVSLKTRAGRLCVVNGRRDLGARLLQEALQRYAYTPRPRRRRERHWAFRAQYSLFFVR